MTNFRGVNILQIDPFNCILLKVNRFDTVYPSTASSDLMNYLQSVSNGTVLVGVTSNGSIADLPLALDSFSNLGISLGDVKQGGSFAFVTEIGHSYDKTILNKSRSYLDAAATLNVLLFGEFISLCIVDIVSPMLIITKRSRPVFVQCAH
jgi:hypothetical protein